MMTRYRNCPHSINNGGHGLHAKGVCPESCPVNFESEAWEATATDWKRRYEILHDGLEHILVTLHVDHDAAKAKAIVERLLRENR